MKTIISVILLILMIVSFASCTATSRDYYGRASITSFREIPGITEDNVAQIEQIIQNNDRLILGHYQSQKAFLRQNGSIGGFAPLLSEWLSKVFEIEFYLQLFDHYGLNHGISNQTIDFSGDFIPPESDMHHFYVSYPIAERSALVFMYTGRGLNLQCERDVNGLRVGIMPCMATVNTIELYFPHLDFDVVQTACFSSAAEMLMSAEMDIFVTENIFYFHFDQHDGITQVDIFTLVYTPVSVTTGNTQLEPIIEAFDKFLRAGGRGDIYSLYLQGMQEYTRYSLHSLLSNDEREFLNRLRETGETVRVGFESTDYPISFFDTSAGRFQGIAVDLLYEIGSLTGLEFEVVVNQHTTWEEMLVMLETGDLAILSNLLYTPERADRFLWTDYPFFTTYHVLVSRVDFHRIARHQLPQYRVGTMRDSAYAELYQTWFPDSENLFLYDDMLLALDALSHGRVDLVMGTDNTLLLHRHHRGRAEFVVNLRFASPANSYFGLNLEEELMRSIISTAQLFVDIEPITEFWENRWIVYELQFVQERAFYIALLAVLLAIALLTVIILWFKKRKLSRSLDIRVKEVVSEIELAQQTVASMFNLNPQMNLLFNSNFEIIDCNPAAYRFMGFDSKEEMLSGFNEFYLASFLEEQADGKTTIHLEERLKYVEKNGACKYQHEMIIDGNIWVLDIEIIKVQFGKGHAYVAYLYDMTDIRRHEKELLHARKINELQLTKLNMAVRATNIALWDIELLRNEDGGIKYIYTWSDEMRYMLGYDDEHDFPNSFSSLLENVHPEDKEHITAAMNEHLNDHTGTTKYDVECRIMNKGGDYAYYRGMGEAIRDNRGNPLRVCGTIMDISETKFTLLSSERQRIEAEAANKAKSAFLSTMSHEIRTPPNAILGVSEMQLQRDDIDAPVSEAFEKIHSSGDLLLGIINDILDLSKIESGKMEIVDIKYELASVICDTTQLNAMHIGSKPITFNIHIDENLPSHLYGDELRIKQILNNILSNAFKYTAEGTVDFSTSMRENSEEGKIDIIFTISDTGYGMTQEQVAMLFEEYSRFNIATNREAQGTGLGMPITRDLVGLMGGQLLLESDFGRGSVFTVILPQTIASDDKLGKETAQNLRQLNPTERAKMYRMRIVRDPMPYGKVLIVDDVATNIYVAQGLMAPYGLKIDSADSGYAVLNKIEEGEVYDVIFMDHMMPSMDGVEATGLLRQAGYDRPIVALTANAIAGQSDFFLANGFDDYLSKPIDIRVLNNILNKYVRDRQSSDVIAAARAAGALQSEDTSGSGDFTPNSLVEDGAPKVKPRFAAFFIKDAEKAHTIMQSVSEATQPLTDEELNNFTISIHGMKSALANIGEMKCSEKAREIEQMAQDCREESIKKELPEFLDALQQIIDKLRTVQ